jgi:hypothetical protein
MSERFSGHSGAAATAFPVGMTIRRNRTSPATGGRMGNSDVELGRIEQPEPYFRDVGQREMAATMSVSAVRNARTGLSGPADIADIRKISDSSPMRCFYVLVHGKLNWRSEPIPGDDEPGALRPRGFYCHRYVLARDTEEAQSKAFRRVRENLERQTGWLSLGLATLYMEAEELTLAPMHKVLTPDNKGHTFYEKD